MLTEKQQNDLSDDGIILRGGVFLEEEDLLEVISQVSFIEDHPQNGHYYVGMHKWETVRKGFNGHNQFREPTGSVPSLHTAILPGGRWLLWSSKTEDAPAHFEVRFPKPRP